MRSDRPGIETGKGKSAIACESKLLFVMSTENTSMELVGWHCRCIRQRQWFLFKGGFWRHMRGTESEFGELRRDVCKHSSTSEWWR